MTLENFPLPAGGTTFGPNAALPVDDPSRTLGVYGISVAAELSGTAADSLRLWERHGLLMPARTNGGTRRYSSDDLTRIRRITTLVAAGVNIAGIARILDLEDDNTALRAASNQQRPHPHTR